MCKNMTAGNRTRTVLTLAAVAMAILLTTTHQVSAVELTYDATVQVSENESVFNVSVFPGKAGYNNGTVSGIFGDGTVTDYRFFTADTDTLWSWADGGAGRVAPVTSPPPENVTGNVNNSQNWPDVWITSDPDTDPADFTTNTQAGAQNITGTIDISGLGSGTLYFIYGTYYNPNTLSLTMSGTGQPDVVAEHTEDPPNTVNFGWVSSFDFSGAGAYNTITYTYTNTDVDASRARFMGVIVDGGDISKAHDPNPANEQPDVLRDSDLSWSPGISAARHNVYMGESFDDVDTATVPTGPGLDVNSFDPGRLDFGQTYYWRVDAVNAPPDSTVFKGLVWSFTTEPVAYPIENITTTASSSMAGSAPEKTVDGSGLDDGDLHSVDLADSWLSDMFGTQPTWIEYQFDKVYKLHEMWVWNQNQIIESTIGYGFKDVSIEYSVDGIAYTTLGTTHEFARGSAAPGYAANTTVDFEGVAAKYVKLTANTNWGGILAQYGLSEVRFFNIPVLAKEPSPASGATDVGVDVTLAWRAGREAAKHDVYLSTDEQAVIDGTAPVVTVTDASYSTSLDVDSTYYWRIDEVNDAETPTAWQGDIWNFTTPEFLVVDDFESYNDIEAGQEGSNLVYDTWIDGFNNPSVNGATMGYTVAFQPSLETSIVYDGDQSAPLFYDNTTAGYSEITANVADLQVVRDWTKYGITALTLWFKGDLSHAAADQLYVKINNTKVVYDGDLSTPLWQPFNVDLASLGINLSNITTLSIGVDGGGSGMLYVDEIALYRIAPLVAGPPPGGDPSLVGHWKLDETSGLTAADSSGYGNDGTLTGMTGTEWTAGIKDRALEFAGGNANNPKYVDFGNPRSLQLYDNVTISAWVKMNAGNDAVYMGIGGKLISGYYQGFSLVRHTSNVFRLWCDDGAGVLAQASSDTTYTDTEWHHVAGVVDDGTSYLYVDGVKQVQEGVVDLTDSGGIAYIGKQYGDNSSHRYWNGLIDDVRIYYRALSEQEILGL